MFGSCLIGFGRCLVVQQLFDGGFVVVVLRVDDIVFAVCLLMFPCGL